MDPAAHRTARRDALVVAKAAEERRALGISSLRVVVFLLGAGSAASAVFAGTSWTLWVAVALSAAFLGLVLAHARSSREEERLARALAFQERGLARLGDRLADLPARDGPADAPPFARDLDLFGPRSVLSVLDALGSEGGRRVLGRALVAPPEPSALGARIAAARALASRPDLVEAIARERFDAAAMPVLEDSDERRSRVPLVAGIVLPPLTLAAALVARAGRLPDGVYVGLLALQAMAAWVAQGDVVGLLRAQAGLGRLSSIGDLAGAIWGERTGDPLVDGLLADLGRARAGHASLHRLASWAEVRSSVPLGLLFAWLLLFDVWLGFAFRRWRVAHAEALRGARAAMDELEALADVGTFLFENPDASFADVVEGEPMFRAEGLAHPLLPRARRVPNDVLLGGPGTLLFITGSNMSGKSTLLRAMGLAVVLGRAGIPVTARRLMVSPMSLGTSLRVSDSVADGVSHFYAELLALRRVVDLASVGPTLFLLDEVLHGTNSEERHAGAKAVVLHLLAAGAMGVLTTHDLALVDLVDELGERVRPVHLVELARGEELAFDYKLRDGVLRSGNALALMRTLGLPVGDALSASRSAAAPGETAGEGRSGT